MAETDCGAVVLAAGRAKRMGRPKVLLPWRGRPLLAHILETLSQVGLCPVVVVTGPDTPSLEPLRAQFGIELVYHAHARAGMGGSLAAGVRALRERVCAALICLGDQPTLSVEALRAVVAHARAGRPVVPLYRGWQGHPVLFPAHLFPELRVCTGDVGGRAVLARHAPLEVNLDLPLPADVDTPDDYHRLVTC